LINSSGREIVSGAGLLGAGTTVRTGGRALAVVFLVLSAIPTLDLARPRRRESAPALFDHVAPLECNWQLRFAA
jgi:hypothetical protein